MNSKKCTTLWFLLLALTILLCAYPIYMGVNVAAEVVRNGAVSLERYPKYVIPYTPIAAALVLGTLLLPLWRKLAGKWALLPGALCSTAAFFVLEWIMETKILVQTTEPVLLESWQMALCYVPPEQYQTRVWEAVDVLLGGYSPAFKLHFYLISVVIILSLLNVIYGLVRVLCDGETARKKPLTVQAVTALAFLGMCIWACFTAFYRTGELTVSPLSAMLMALFFVLLGVTVGVFAGSLLLGKKTALSIVLPALAAVVITAAMYAGELILLSGHLYRFGSGFFFDGLDALVLAPVDLLVILLSGAFTAVLCIFLNTKQDSNL